MDPSERSSRRTRLRWLTAGGLVVVVAAVLAAVLLGSGPGGHRGPESGVPAGDTTASVTRRTLSESSTVSGTLGYGTTLELYDRLGGTFTWLPSVGALIGRGGTLWRIDDLPIVLMYGSVPAYRTLERGVSDGPDVTELNENLIDLGFDPYGAITDDETFSEATAAAVKRWQKADGLPETGEVELGRVVFAPGARRVTDVKVTLGQDPPKDEDAKDDPGKASPSGEAGAGAGEGVLTTTSTQQIVQLKVKPEQQQLAKLGESVTVQLPGGDQAPGRVTEVGTVASEASSSGDEPKGSGGESAESTIPVTITLDHDVAHLDEAPVSVELVKGIRRNVLTVPATALIATAGGGYAIEALASASNDRRLTVAVTPGMFAGGYVQVEGAGVREGMTVIESQ